MIRVQPPLACTTLGTVLEAEAPYQQVIRARIVLDAARGDSNATIARQRKVSADTVRLWRGRDRWISPARGTRFGSCWGGWLLPRSWRQVEADAGGASRLSRSPPPRPRPVTWHRGPGLAYANPA